MKENKIPKFKYQPNIKNNEAVIFNRNICDCCGKNVEAYIENMYCKENVNCICLNCIDSGAASEKYDGTFIQDAEFIEDKDKRDELFKRTPGYISWQGEHWLTCCNDYCEFIGNVGIEELEEMKLSDKVIFEYEQKSGNMVDKKVLSKNGTVAGYLFRCLHCKEYHLWVDMA